MSSTIYHNHHIIPKHIGGTDNLSNLVKLTVKDHAEAHKKLYEKYGRWQDKLAWQGLSGIIGHEECVKLAIIEGGKLGAKRSNEIQYKFGTRKCKPCSQWNIKKKNFRNQQTYEIQTPNGSKTIITNLSKYCRENNLNYKTIHQKAQRKYTKSKDGYLVSKIK